jgi:hypothetical protein
MANVNHEDEPTITTRTAAYAVVVATSATGATEKHAITNANSMVETETVMRDVTKLLRNTISSIRTISAIPPANPTRKRLKKAFVSLFCLSVAREAQEDQVDLNH